jgi:hypothetical protein
MCFDSHLLGRHLRSLLLPSHWFKQYLRANVLCRKDNSPEVELRSHERERMLLRSARKLSGNMFAMGVKLAVGFAKHFCIKP